jgi:phosphomannomutase/phosphoglucomutase
MNKNIFRAYDVRGVYPSELNQETAYKIGVALANKISGDRKAVIAMDGRLSGPFIKKSLIDGLISQDVDVTDCGMLPTPMLYFATKELNIANGFMITGSHNPKNYNGIKIILDDKPLFDKGIYALRDWIVNNIIEEVGNNDKPNISSDIADKYIKRIKEDISINLEDKFVIDCMNGITGSVIENVTRAFNINAEFINSAVDGNYPNCDPDPTKESNLEMLKEKIIETDAEYGVAFDGDGDRLVIIKKNGDIIWPDQLMILFSKSILADNQNAKIVYDVKCTKNLKKTIEDSNGIPIESRTGHSYIKQTIKKESAKLGGEMSGHIFFNDKWYGFDDGIYVFLRFLEILSNEPDLINHLSDLPETYTTSEIDIAFQENDHFEFMERFIENNDFNDYKVSYLDGIKITDENSWGLIRASNTSPKITLRFEALSENSLINIKNEIKNAILKIDNTIELPF